MSEQPILPLQYMRDVGVDQHDVAWYARFAASAGMRTPGDLSRASRIADQAFQGLCQTIISRPVQQVI